MAPLRLRCAGLRPQDNSKQGEATPTSMDATVMPAAMDTTSFLSSRVVLASFKTVATYWGLTAMKIMSEASTT